MLKVHILARNNSETIGRCIGSLSGLPCVVVVADMGSDDDTANRAEAMGASVVRVEFSGDFSSLRNSLCSEGWNMYLEPWERLVRGREVLASAAGPLAFYVAEGGVVSKQVRLWDSGRFENPVFESLAGCEASVSPSVVVVSDGRPDERKTQTEICRGWVAKRPTSPEPYYYLACALLAEGRREEFKSAAKTYLSMVPPRGDSCVLMNYYLSGVEMATGDPREAYRRAMGCVVACPAFAEFWCLLGDMLCQRGDYRRAISMYENAMVAGKRRRSDDFFPIEVSKYESYPMGMVEKCRNAMSRPVIVGSYGTR